MAEDATHFFAASFFAFSSALTRTHTHTHTVRERVRERERERQWGTQLGLGDPV